MIHVVDEHLHHRNFVWMKVLAIPAAERLLSTYMHPANRANVTCQRKLDHAMALRHIRDGFISYEQILLRNEHILLAGVDSTELALGTLGNRCLCGKVTYHDFVIRLNGRVGQDFTRLSLPRPQAVEYNIQLALAIRGAGSIGVGIFHCKASPIIGMEVPKT